MARPLPDAPAPEGTATRRDMEAALRRHAALDGIDFQGADLRGADLGALRLIDATRFKGATISKRQAAELLSGLGLKVP